ncbi:hypothetical protein ABK040_011229 [Willaertia magna]
MFENNNDPNNNNNDQSSIPIIKRLRLEFQYDGTNYFGFQRQFNVPIDNSIQFHLEKAFKNVIKGYQQFSTSSKSTFSSITSSFLSEENKQENKQKMKDLTIIAGSRTDQGVHAIHNTAHLDICINLDRYGNVLPNNQINKLFQITSSSKDNNDDINNNNYNNNNNQLNLLKKALNVQLQKESISIIQIEMLKDKKEYHARRDVISRVYLYRIIDKSDCLLPLEKNHAWMIEQELDIHLMREASKSFLGGPHDFTCFCSTSDPTRTRTKNVIKTERTIDRIEIEEVMEEKEKSLFNRFNKERNREIRIWIEAKAFLKHQIRFMVEVLVKIGLRELPSNIIEEKLLKSGKRTKETQYMAPACGLYLYKVNEKARVILE